jgi:hypothetical protein
MMSFGGSLKQGFMQRETVEDDKSCTLKYSFRLGQDELLKASLCTIPAIGKSTKTYLSSWGCKKNERLKKK